MIHFHGTPFSSLANCARVLSGRHGLASFATSGTFVDVIAEVCQSFVLDNGAFSSWRSGNAISDWRPCYDWYEKWINHPGCDFALIPDVIDGDEKANDILIGEWPFGIRGVPVWHYHESLGRLSGLCERWPRVALGSSGDWPTPGTSSWWKRTDLAMKSICDPNGFPKTKLHGLRMLNPEIFSIIPLSSADSCNAGRNCGDMGKRMNLPPDCAAEIIVGRIESHNSPARWMGITKTEESGMFDFI